MRTHLSAVVEDGYHKHHHQYDTHPIPAQVMQPERPKRRFYGTFIHIKRGSQLIALHQQEIMMASPVRLYEVGVEGGSQQEDGQLQHTTQPEENRTGDHGNHAAQHQVLPRR